MQWAIAPLFAAIFFWMKASLSEVYYFTGSQLGNRKLFSHGPHSSKNNFFEIKISRPTPWESLSVLLWLLTTCNEKEILDQNEVYFKNLYSSENTLYQ